MQIPSHVEAMREAQALSMASKGHGHHKVDAPASPAPSEDPAVILDLSAQAQAMIRGAESDLNPAQAARAYLATDSENGFKNFGQLVSSIARGIFDPAAVSETPEQVATLSEEILEEVPAEEAVGNEIPTEEVPEPLVAGIAPVEVGTTEEQDVVEEAAISSSIAGELLDDLLETLGDSEEEGETLT